MSSKWMFPAVMAGGLLGWLCAAFLANAPLTEVAHAAQTAFLGALRMVIAPLIFFSLISGILHLKNATAMRRLGGATLGYYLLTTGLAIAVGITVVTVIHPWTSHPPLQIPATDAQLLSADAASTSDVLRGLLGRMFVNPVEAMADMNILGLVTNALIIGLACLVVLPKESPVIVFFDQGTQIMYRVAGWVLMTLPIGVFAIIYRLALETDATTLWQLGGFVSVVFGATAVHGLILLPCIAWLIVGEPPWSLLKKIAAPMATAFATSSSSATLPLSLQVAENDLGVSRSTAGFVLPLGATMNMDGTALFEGIAAVFLAYMFGIELGAVEIVVVFLVAMLASVGAPGIPSGSMAGMQMVMLAIGIPLEAIGLLLVVERPLDTFRTAVNVEGDLIGSLVVDKVMNRVGNKAVDKTANKTANKTAKKVARA